MFGPMLSGCSAIDPYLGAEHPDKLTVIDILFSNLLDTIDPGIHVVKISQDDTDTTDSRSDERHIIKIVKIAPNITMYVLDLPIPL